MNNRLYQFTDEYKEKCFYSWYENKEKPRQKMLDALPKDENGRTPGYQTIIAWRDNFGWIERADALDAEVSVRVENQLIKKTAKRYEQLAEVGEELMQMARDYLKAQGFDSAASAVRAIGLGGEMVSKYAGMADKISALSGMSNRQLEVFAQRLLGNQDKDENVITAYADDLTEESDEQQDSDQDTD